MIKLSSEILKKFAEAVDRDPELSRAAKFVSVAAGPGVQSAATYITNKLNDAVEQDSNIGRLFAEYSKRKLNSEYPRFIQFSESVPRAYGPLVEQKVVSPLIEAVAHYPANIAYSTPGSPMPVEMSENIAATLFGSLQDEAFDRIPRNLTEGLSEYELNAIKDSVGPLDIAPWLKKKYGIDEVAHITTPKNNLYAMAHELGHASDLNRIDEIGTFLEKRLPGSHKLLHNALDVATGPVYSLLSDYTKFFPEKMRALEETSPIMAEMTRGALGGSLPGMITGLLGTSQTARDVVRKVLPFEATDSAMDFVERHPAAVAASGFIPQLINEAYTGIPGFELTKGFYESLNKLNINKLAPDMLADLGSYAKRIGSFKPEWEAMKFLGHNLLSNLTYAAPPLVAAAVAYLNAPKKKEE